MAQDFLLEIGTEELPASFVDAALQALPGLLAERLSSLRLRHGTIHTFGTPRRLAVLVEGLVERQPDHREEVSGPPERAAFDSEGRPTRAAEGFARKLGIAVSDLQILETPKGRYVFGVKEEPGRPTAEVLREALPEMLRAVPFRKSMRWGAERQAFGRPIQWIVALHGSEVIPFRFADVTAGRSSRGHRFLAPDSFEFGYPAEYVERLRAAHVMVDVEERRAAIEEGLRQEAARLGGAPVSDDALLAECLHMVEWPFVLPGAFEARFLALPESLVVAVMRDHQYYFAVRDASGTLLPHYLNVVNNAGDPARIQAGNDRVLRARLRDAEFFVGQDLKHPLLEARAELERVVFHKQLGSLAQRTARTAFVAHGLLVSRDPEEAPLAAVAAWLSKADLVTLTVGEFPELEGQFGGYLAERQAPEDALPETLRLGPALCLQIARNDRERAAVSRAIAEHVLPRGAADALPTSLPGTAAAAADRLDLLVSGFAAGLRPSGSQDPYGLRRAALGILRLALEGHDSFDLVPREALDLAMEAWRLPGQDAPVAEALQDQERVEALRDEVLGYLCDRLEVFFAQRHPRDVVRAALSAWRGEPPKEGGRSLRDLAARVQALDAFRQGDEAFGDLAVAFKRVFHISKDAEAAEPDASALRVPAERALWEAWLDARPRVRGTDYPAAFGAVGRLRPAVDRFFEEVFVMDEDPRVRHVRLGMLAEIRRELGALARFELLEG